MGEHRIQVTRCWGCPFSWWRPASSAYLCNHADAGRDIMSRDGFAPPPGLPIPPFLLCRGHGVSRGHERPHRICSPSLRAFTELGRVDVVATARQALPDLLAYVRRLEGELAAHTKPPASGGPGTGEADV